MARRKVGFWRWYLRRLAIGALCIGFIAVMLIGILALAMIGFPAALRWLVDAPLYQQIISTVVPFFAIVTFLEFIAYRREDC